MFGKGAVLFEQIILDVSVYLYMSACPPEPLTSFGNFPLVVSIVCVAGVDIGFCVQSYQCVTSDVVQLAKKLLYHLI